MRGTGWKNRGQDIYRREEERTQALWGAGGRGGGTAHTSKDGGKKEELVWAGSRWMTGLTLTVAAAEATACKKHWHEALTVTKTIRGGSFWCVEVFP